MSPGSMSPVYLPDLGKCFTGDLLLSSWDDLLDAILSHDPRRCEKAIEILSGDRPKHVLSQTIPTFPPPSTNSKTAFDTTAGAIPAISDLYDVAQIKSDALWLSKQENLDELESLRVVVLEWQYRPEARISHGLSEAESASLRQIQRTSHLDTARQLKTRGDDLEFDEPDARRSRLISRFLEQKVVALRIHRELLDLQALPEQLPYWFPKLSGLAADVLATARNESLDGSLQAYLNVISTQLTDLHSPHKWDLNENQWPALDDAFHTSTLQLVAATIEEVLVKVRSSNTPPSTDSLLSWLRLMLAYGFFDSFTSVIPRQQNTIKRLQAAAALTGASLFNLGYSISTLAEFASSNSPVRSSRPNSYFFDPEAAGEINGLLAGPALAGNESASMVILSWAIVLQQIRRSALESRDHREGSTQNRLTDGVATFDAAPGRRASSSGGSSVQQSVFEDVWDTIKEGSPDDPATNEKLEMVDLMLDAAVSECHAFDFIADLGLKTQGATTMLSAYKLQTLQELVTVSLPFLSYTPELVSAQLALMAPKKSSQVGPILFDSTVAMLEDDSLLQGFYEVSAARFPYEALPFLKFSKELAKAKVFDHGVHFVEYRLRSLDSFTQAAIRDVEFNTTRENENANLVTLTKAVNLLDMSQHMLLGYSERQPQTLELMPPNTIGNVISGDSQLPVIRWQHEYSGFGYIGKLLEMYYMGLAPTVLSNFESSEEVAAEILSLVAVLLTTVFSEHPTSTQEAQRHATRILEELNTHLGEDTDFVTLAFEILEQELQAFRRRSVSSFDCRVLTACLDFVIIYTKIRPGQVWSAINRTSLFNRQIEGGLIMSIISVVEIPLRKYDLLERCSVLHHTLIKLALHPPLRDDAVSKMEPARGTITHKSFLSRNQVPTPLASTEIMFGVFQQIQDWPFAVQEQAARIRSRLAKAFSDTISFAFNFGDSLKSSQETSAPFMPAAEFLVNALRFPLTDNVSMGPIIKFFLDTTFTECSPEEADAEGQIKAGLELAILVTRYGQVQDLPLSSHEIHMFHTLPVLIRILHSYPQIRPTTLILLRSLLTYIDNNQPSSLLAVLGSTSSLDFLHLLKHIDQSSISSKSRDEVWRLLPLLVRGSQHWLATVILSGSSPDASKRAKDPKPPGQSLRGMPFLQIAIKQLMNISTLPHNVTISMLKFVLQAQSTWAWVTESLQTSEEFFAKTISFIVDSRIEDDEQTNMALHNSIAALITDLSTIHLHHSKLSQDRNAIKQYVPLLRWLGENAIKVSSYNASLHANLKRNFAAKYRGLAVSAIRRTGLIERRYGGNFFYDVDFAGRFLGSDPYWSGGKDKEAGSTFSSEFRRANANLSLVDSQLTLLLSLQHFCVEHCSLFAQEREDQKLLAFIVQNCLVSNSEAYPLESLFDDLFQTRADLSIALLQTLLSVNAKSSSISGLLEPAWSAVRARSGSYELAIINNDLLYWRSILYVLLMVIRFHVNRSPKSTTVPGTSTSVIALDPANVTFLEIASRLVTDGFKTVVSTLQEQKLSPSKISKEGGVPVGERDISLLMTILQTILRLPNLAQFSSELSNRISSSGMISSCLLLYSWSHLLTRAETDHEPRYADLCAQILASVSSLPLVAEELAIEGVLSRILSSKTTEVLQRVPGGVSHHDQRPHCTTLYKIWAGGLLPLCLNLLHAVGGGISEEISNFLNSFPNQLARASGSFMLTLHTRKEGTDVLTLPVVNEASTLALISFMLSSYRQAGASAAVEPERVLPLAGYDEHRKAIMDDLRDVLALKPELRKRMTVPTDEREAAAQKAGNGDELDAKITREIRLALAALRREGDDDERS
ncbi:hypothetical protein B0A52_08950 [Exophiala mesophila]|uniref:Nucleoporin NUP188 n=1 Tax=Exophiala mesophila TaxID=212818 RepID=A0A438MSX8_EXOME|nr:hypothetical protein B0A52_08950 [Exophiala mesophila]